MINGNRLLIKAADGKIRKIDVINTERSSERNVRLWFSKKWDSPENDVWGSDRVPRMPIPPAR